MSYQVKDISQYYEIIKEKLVVGCPNFFSEIKIRSFFKTPSMDFRNVLEFLYILQQIFDRYQIYRNIVLYPYLHKMFDFFFYKTIGKEISIATKLP